MLVLSRKVGEQIVINGDITITVLDARKGRIRLGISAPSNVPVNRSEIQAAKETVPIAEVKQAREKMAGKK